MRKHQIPPDCPGTYRLDEGIQRKPQEPTAPGLAKTLQRSRTRRIEKATLTPTSALGEHLQNRQLEKSVSWTGRERLRRLSYRLRLTIQEMNYATLRRLVELQSRLP